MVERFHEDADADANSSQSGAGTGVNQIDRAETVSRSFNRANQDIGADEAQSRGLANDSDAWSANKKRTYDEFMNVQLEATKRSRDHYDNAAFDSRSHTQAVNKLVIDRLANATVADKLGTDRMWNLDEQSADFVVALSKLVELSRTANEV